MTGLSPHETLSVRIVKSPRCGLPIRTDEDDEHFGSCSTSCIVTCLDGHFVPVIVFDVIVFQFTWESLWEKEANDDNF